MSEQGRAELNQYLGRAVPTGGPLCMTRQERRILTKKVQVAMGYVVLPGAVHRITHWGGERIEICEEVHDND